MKTIEEVLGKLSELYEFNRKLKTYQLIEKKSAVSGTKNTQTKPADKIRPKVNI